ncbi:hypothetical protein PN36_31050 [Candidatus Thiomargarita nelsonii]|uniref:Toprim domain-containing protein n=1 Tax=Candidatus Thiomargarita nelsonii TaxID=1003181 RepID=A0A4E0QLS9_9GAMM|nr:hypothetical protein PN36_31050 [Candidatus Thiomargarita nelsonii]
MAYNPNNRFTKWLKESRSLIESRLLDSITDFFKSLVSSSHINIPNYPILDDQWHYMDRQKTCGYRGHQSTDRNGVPIIKCTFNDFKNGGYSQAFKGNYELVHELWEQHKGDNPTEKRKADAEKRAQERRAEIKARKKNDAIAKAENVQREIAKFFQLSFIPTREQDGYFKNKGFEKISPEWGVRYGTDSHGDFSAILLKNIETGKPVGVQKFYAHKIAERNTNKLFTWGLIKKGACYIIGQINPQKPQAMVCEGLADGIRLYITYGIPIVVVLDANGYAPIVPILRTQYPQIEGIIVCDNDAHKYHKMDNVGILKGINAAQKSNFKIIIPQFSLNSAEKKPTDVCDLYALYGASAVQALLDSAIEPLTGFAWQCTKLNYIGLRDSKITKPLYQSVLELCISGAKQTPLRALADVEKEIFETIKKQHPRLSDYAAYNETKLIKYAHKILHQQYNKLIQKSIIAQDSLPDDVQIVSFDLQHIDNKLRIPPKINEQIINAQTGLHILMSPKDTGKTFSIIKPAVKLARQNLDFPVGVTPYIVLSRDVSSKCDSTNYQDIAHIADAEKADSLAVTINSLTHPRLAPLINKSNFFYADEIDAVYDACTIGTVKTEKRKPLFDCLQKKLGTKKAIVTGADTTRLLGD